VGGSGPTFRGNRKYPLHGSPEIKNQRANLRRAKGSRTKSPAQRISKDGSGTVELLAWENRLVTDPSDVTVVELPPPKLMPVFIASEVSGVNVSEPVPVVVSAGPCVNWFSNPGVENSVTMTPPVPVEVAKFDCSSQSSKVHKSQVTT
jgi:hypothetical protein